MGVRLVLLTSGILVVGSTIVLPWIQSSSLTLDPIRTIHQSLVILIPCLLLLYSSIVHTKPIWQTFIRGLLSIPFGALALAFFATTLGAPFESPYALSTLYWSLFMSTLMIAPAAVVLGTSWRAWERVLSFAKPRGSVELSICICGHFVAIGAWIGAWPIPLDWDKKWQEWPISCTYGAIVGYSLGVLLTLAITVYKRTDCSRISKN